MPWLGLPLGGFLAWTAFGQAFWSYLPVANPTELDSSSSRSDSSGLLSAAPASRRPERWSDLQGDLRIGETLGHLLSRKLGLSAADASTAAEAAARHLDLRQLRAGTPWQAYLDDNGRLDRLDLEIAGRGELELVRAADGWDPNWTAYRRSIRLRTVRGVLNGSLEASMSELGAPFELAYAMAEVLQWDLDFSRDLQPGDEFRVLYEEVEVERSPAAPGRILAVEYGHPGGRKLSAFRFGDDAVDPGSARTASGSSGSSGYYDSDGRPLQKMFLRSPLAFSRVTSRFTHRRLHPVLGVFRPHYGVDYGAPTGTPVRVTASGTVVGAGWEGGGGRTVKVRHANDFLTAYLHLSRFASGLRPGLRVRQGDLIGYVGSTGLATAPHLDYRVQRAGRWIDPMAVHSAPAEPIPELRLADFRAVRDAMRASLESGQPYSPPPAAFADPSVRVAAGTQPVSQPGRSPGET